MTGTTTTPCGSESLLLLIGGDETTRHVISGGLFQLLANRDQWDRLRADRSLLPSAIEEMLRWVSPVKNMARSVTRDTTFGGKDLRAGQTDHHLHLPARPAPRHSARGSRRTAGPAGQPRQRLRKSPRGLHARRADRGPPVTYKVLQFGTGNVGRHAMRAIVERPDLDLVGVRAYTLSKLGSTPVF